MQIFLIKSETCGTVAQESDDDLQKNQKLEEEKQIENLKPKCQIQVKQVSIVRLEIKC